MIVSSIFVMTQALIKTPLIANSISTMQRLMRIIRCVDEHNELDFNPRNKMVPEKWRDADTLYKMIPMYSWCIAVLKIFQEDKKLLY